MLRAFQIVAWMCLVLLPVRADFSARWRPSLTAMRIPPEELAARYLRFNILL